MLFTAEVSLCIHTPATLVRLSASVVKILFTENITAVFSTHITWLVFFLVHPVIGPVQ